ncbi:MAG: putative nucleotidyltransferase substrate binding domain-containing protein [Solirubrobacteraceae bacterium]
MTEIVRFLAQRPPFDALAPQELAEVAAQATIEFHLAGEVILSEDGGPVTFLRVVHSGGVDIAHEGRLLDLLGPGDTFGHASMLSGLPPGLEARAAEDTLSYRIPVGVARPLLDRARRRELQVGDAAGGEPVAKLIRTPTVTCKPSESIGIVAERMTAAGASSAIVELDGGEMGIVTDRDLRTRVLAAGRSGGARIDSAMTAPVFVVSPDRLGAEVLYEMLERGIRHAPVVSDRGQLIGVLEDADLFAAQPRSWFGARRTIARARNLDQLGAVAERLPSLMLDLRRSNVAALELARVLTALADALTCRAIELALPQAELPEEGIVWVAVGSQARRELTLASSRRGALVCSAQPPARWLDALGAALSRCGVGGPVIAHDAEHWTRAAERDELALSVLADRRALWGTPVQPLPVADGVARSRLLDALAAHAFTHSPPTGFDADGVLRLDGRRSDRLDIRLSAIVPIAALGRWAAAMAGSEEVSTPERLRAAAAEGVLQESQSSTLAEAFELALELRIVHQLEQLAAGEAPDDLLDPAAMTPLTRGRLRDVFRAVGTVTRELRP